MPPTLSLTAFNPTQTLILSASDPSSNARPNPNPNPNAEPEPGGPHADAGLVVPLHKLPGA